MLAYPDAQVLDVVGPLEVFSRTTRWLASTWGRTVPAYTTEVVASEPGPVRTSQGLELIATRSCNPAPVGAGRLGSRASGQ